MHHNNMVSWLRFYVYSDNFYSYLIDKAEIYTTAICLLLDNVDFYMIIITLQSISNLRR